MYREISTLYMEGSPIYIGVSFLYRLFSREPSAPPAYIESIEFYIFVARTRLAGTAGIQDFFRSIQR
jgi:hypothetical protein